MKNTDPFENQEPSENPESKKPEPQEVSDFTMADLEAAFAETSDGPSVAEAKAQAEQDAKAAKKKKEEVQAAPKITGGSHQTQQAVASSTAVRQTVVKFLQALDPAKYEEYKARKFKGCAKGERPSLEQSKEAYVWAFRQYLDLTYTVSGE